MTVTAHAVTAPVYPPGTVMCISCALHPATDVVIDSDGESFGVCQLCAEIVPPNWHDLPPARAGG